MCIRDRGVAYFLVTEEELPEMDGVTDIDGKCLARSSMLFDKSKLYEKESVTPLEEFIGGAGLDLDEDLDVLTASWFEPNDGLKTIRVMKKYVSENKTLFEEWEGTLVDLNDMEKVLELCVQNSTRWCLGIDV